MIELLVFPSLAEVGETDLTSLLGNIESQDGKTVRADCKFVLYTREESMILTIGPVLKPGRVYKHHDLYSQTRDMYPDFNPSAAFVSFTGLKTGETTTWSATFHGASMIFPPYDEALEHKWEEVTSLLGMPVSFE